VGSFARTEGGLRVRLSGDEVEVLRRLASELRALYDAEDDPVQTRLFPRAYLDPTQEESEREWQSLVHPELRRDRLAALDTVVSTLERAAERPSGREVVLTDEEPEAWLSLLNDARLALGTRLGVTDDTDLDAQRAAAGDDSEAAVYEVYGWLTWLQGDLVEVLMA